MNKVIAAMVGMFLAIVPLCGVWSILCKPIIGGSIDQGFLYPIYGGLILLAGLVVGVAVVLYEEIRKLREEIKSIKEEVEKSKQE